MSGRRLMLKSKLHRATVTHADVDYEGSVTLDRNLLEAADILPYEEVHVWNVTRGSRFLTYAMEAEPGSGIVCINGAAAHLTHPGDLVIIATFIVLETEDAKKHTPRLVLLGEKNRITKTNFVEIPGPNVRP